MCGRYVIHHPLTELTERFAATTSLSEVTPRWNAAPTQALPVIVGGQKGNRLGLMKWGWQRDFLAGKTLVNARGEEAAAKKTFSEAFRQRRCLIAASGFYEWLEHNDRPNEPHYFAATDQQPLGILGLWEWVITPQGREPHFVLLTTPANDVVAPVHHRMAALTGTLGEHLWLYAAMPIAQLLSLLSPADPDVLSAQRASNRVNDIRNDHAGIIQHQGDAEAAPSENQPTIFDLDLDVH